MSEFLKETYANISRFNWKSFTDKNLTRQLTFITDIGVAVLPVDDVLQVCGQPLGVSGSGIPDGRSGSTGIPP